MNRFDCVFSAVSVWKNKVLGPGRKKKYPRLQKRVRLNQYAYRYGTGLSRMNRTKFDAFGEQLDLGEKAPVHASKWLMRVGSSLFWAIAIAIVLARATYFEPGIYDQFARVAALFQKAGNLL